MIAIIDYKLGNLRSVAGAVARLGHEPRITSRPEDLKEADKLILPGVGAFADGMKNLRELGLIEPLAALVLNDCKPILGICLGFQLMAMDSSEFGYHEGLGWLDASVIRIEPDDPGLRIPHVGWNDLRKAAVDPLFREIPDDALFYYVHSYHVRCNRPEIVLGTCDYGVPFVAAVRQNNIYAVQFHPEKSQLAGLQLLKNFLNEA